MTAIAQREYGGASYLLNGERAISKSQVKKLAELFNVHAGHFI
jgi:hypothetical protein